MILDGSFGETGTDPTLAERNHLSLDGEIGETTTDPRTEDREAGDEAPKPGKYRTIKMN